ncbi:MAG: hypothetical protein COW76_19595 [Shewanella sp. CG18_big_fil_WC_8_21_14_2_50_42_11]|uniref:PD-(D/E)XK nuclease family protein n=1 Tax=Shewanella sp. CG18_big_fil_WC_8_21_14_2_50_42_11 TaxID=1975538 RepID=UPI000C485A58|nr:PD-(D/E)XK nuclease family protein [Shewanella sp. CG18_big_fil_WC_8_21_14_2_50_42_11]PIP98699.1 MAG: hypothetical protein COW76_19595 [Shewanella sp. CG18_big_fil_WC_8_21_14_2_50_42_11]
MLPQQCYDNTQISSYKTCPRSYFIRHVLEWRGTGTAIPLVFGLSWHNSMDALYTNKDLPHRDVVDLAYEAFVQEWERNGFNPVPSLSQDSEYSPRTPTIAKEMLDNYLHTRRRLLHECELVSCEQPVAVPMPTVDDTWYIGRLDKTISYQGQTIILEHKTTTAYATIGNFRSDYVDSWYSSSQVKGYQFMGSLYYPDKNAPQVWVDASLVHKKVHDAFKLIPINHSAILLQEWLVDTTRWIQDIKKDKAAFAEAGELTEGTFKRNEDSCYGKFGSCPFLDICRTCADPSKMSAPPPGFIKEVWEPFSILGLTKLLTTQEETQNG